MKENFFSLNIYSILNTVLHSRFFPYGLQVISLIIFISLIVIGFNVFTPNGMDDKLFAKTNIVTLTVWGVWWPLMIISAIYFGRLWCMVCPLEFVSNLTERISKKIKLKKRNLSKIAQRGIYIVIIYAFIQILVAGFHIHRIPAYTSFLLIGLISLAVVTGLLFKNRAFCRGFCPIGLLLNFYGRTGMFIIKINSGAICNNCTSKTCTSSINRDFLLRRSCPSLLNPVKLESNIDCLLCTQCIKSCEYNNVSLSVRKPFNLKDKFTKLNFAGILFSMILFGFVTYELCTEWGAAKSVFLLIPNFISNYLELSDASGLIKGFWTILFFPSLFFLLISSFMKIFSNVSILEVFKTISLPIIVIISSGHLIKALLKLNSWIVYFPDAFKNNSTLNSAKYLQSNSFHYSSLMNSSLISIFGLILLTFSLTFALKRLKLIKQTLNLTYIIPILLVYALFIFIVTGITLNN